MSSSTHFAESAGSGNEYIFRRDYKSAVRQNFNHWIMKGLTTYLLHPSIKLPSAAAVADVGCGTSIWLQELAEQMPAPTRLQGFDISSSMFPAPSLRAENVTLTVHDCLKPFPAEHLAQYDVVHVRFFRCILTDSLARLFLENITTIIKPGGYLQWFEGLALESAVVSKNPSAPTAAHEQMAAMSRNPTSQSSLRWTQQIPELFRHCGLSMLADDRLGYSDAYRQPWAHSVLLGLDDLAENANEKKRAAYSEWTDRLMGDIAEGVTMESPLGCWVGQKA